jgi:hypothetical protein
MALGLAIAALIAAAIGGGLLWHRRTVGRELGLMTATQASGAGGVASLAPGTIVAVKGTLRVRQPLQAEFSQKPCAYFIAQIERTETYYERDSQGREERRTRTSIVHNNVRYGSCLIEDTTGRVGIDFAGANVEAIETVNEPTMPPAAASGIMGGLMSALSNSSSTYRRKESILPPDIPIYVLGEVHEGGLIGAPVAGSKNKVFVISHKSEEEREKSLASTMRWLLISAIVLLVVAAGLAVWAVKESARQTTAMSVPQETAALMPAPLIPA